MSISDVLKQVIDRGLSVMQLGRASKRARIIREASEFSPARLRANLMMQRTEGTPQPMTLEQIVAARAAQMRGQFALACRMAENMRTDDALFVAYSNRLAPQKCTRVEILPSSDKPKAKSIAGEADALYGPRAVGIAPGALTDIHGSLVNHGVAIGVNSLTQREDGSRFDLLHRFWPLDDVRWDPYRRLLLTRIDPDSVAAGDLTLPEPELGSFGPYEVPIIHGDGRWTIYSSNSYLPWRCDAALLPAALVWARHAFAIRDWGKGSKAHGNSKYVGQLPPGVALQDDEESLTAEAADMIAAMADLASGESTVALTPAGSKVETLANTSTAWQVWNELVMNAEKAAARIYLGTDGTLGSTGGAPGVDIEQLFGVATTKVQGDLETITRCFQEGVIEPWTAINFGDSSLAPTRRYLIPDADADAAREASGKRRMAFFADLQAARDGGFVVNQQHVDATALVYDVAAPTLPAEGDAKAPTIQLAPTDLARVISVNEARASAGLGALLLPDGTPDPDGLLTVEQFGAKKTAALEAGPPGPTPATNGKPAPAVPTA